MGLGLAKGLIKDQDGGSQTFPGIGDAWVEELGE